MAWGYEKSFIIEHDNTLKRKIDCKDCNYYDSSDKSCTKRPLYLPEDGYNSWRTCKYFDLNEVTAKEVLSEWFGFIPEKLVIHYEKPVYEKNHHGRLRKIKTVNCQPLYNSTDWNYIRFDCGYVAYEMYNGTLYILDS